MTDFFKVIEHSSEKNKRPLYINVDMIERIQDGVILYKDQKEYIPVREYPNDEKIILEMRAKYWGAEPAKIDKAELERRGETLI